jgi:hypothetical protein|tara:strand:- start:110 stop:364 length:255 start_codon:yes stop_codon:yes gene_type:complete
MALSKQTTTDKIETLKVQNYYNIQVREAIQVIEDGKVISQNFHRYILNPDANVSTITDAVVKAQFIAIMTDEVKANYQTYLASQ